MLAPDYYYESVFLIPYEKLYNDGIRGIIFDIDNTLTAFNQHNPPAKITALIRRLGRMGFKLCLVTNNTNKRLNTFNKSLGIDGIANAAKPMKRSFRQAMKTMGTTPDSTVIVGDQLFTDIWGGRRMGLTTILVKPITYRDFVWVYAKRAIERRILRKYFESLPLEQRPKKW